MHLRALQSAYASRASQGTAAWADKSYVTIICQLTYFPKVGDFSQLEKDPWRKDEMQQTDIRLEGNNTM